MARSTPSWDQTLPSATRFIVLSNFASAAVLDLETGLVWERPPSTTSRTWSDAQYHCSIERSAIEERERRESANLSLAIALHSGQSADVAESTRTFNAALQARPLAGGGCKGWLGGL